MERLYAPTSIVDWAKSDAYHNSFLISKDQVLDSAVKNCIDHGLPAEIAVSPAHGKFLHLLVRSLSAKRVLEIGTLGGYSSIWMGRAIPDDGELITLEVNETHAKVARENLANAGLEKKCKVILGPAYDSMISLQPETPFDLVFIDADKKSNVKYFTEAKRLVKKGGVIIVDNMVEYGNVSDLELVNPSGWTVGVRELLMHLKEDREVEATTIATVGERGFDGFLFAVRT
ncbi:O-methyltransferase-domain-containing protein [Lentinula raphanica]|uniref:O-methyltransferase-domain-containing protein n=1 Tax=Lentinula raphanica TaxID=153919 RepID=A0AA38P549_9AGAR|nr:O-methyltransferase-domain-containing protein [Lentinula raphanica]KAJ3830682.1 O-methyltransferase-domain-containing protein [Lentinula raphanica]KAJ3836494.1 O-methyltransferase-domain-containing protein [Lentinula raphanica]